MRLRSPMPASSGRSADEFAESFAASPCCVVRGTAEHRTIASRPHGVTARLRPDLTGVTANPARRAPAGASKSARDCRRQRPSRRTSCRAKSLPCAQPGEVRSAAFAKNLSKTVDFLQKLSRDRLHPWNSALASPRGADRALLLDTTHNAL